MKRTSKRIFAEVVAVRELKRNYSDVARMNNESLYSMIQNCGFVWGADSKKWEIKSTSMFADDLGLPSGIIRLRVMAHPDQLESAIHAIQGSNLKVLEVSEPYHNRKGSGIRVYLTCKL
jgi:hypothetical protein